MTAANDDAGARTAPQIDTVIIYLEMTAAPEGDAPPPPIPGVSLEHVSDITPAFYRSLYRDVGEPWLWWERLPLDDEALLAVIAAPGVEIHVLYVDGQPAGFAEIDRRVTADVELRYFGIAPAFIGRGLGGWMLDQVLRIAWRPPAEKVSVNTCDLDHPRALALYQSRGFEICGREERPVDDPRFTGLLPMTAGPHRPPASTDSGSGSRDR